MGFLTALITIVYIVFLTQEAFRTTFDKLKDGDITEQIKKMKEAYFSKLERARYIFAHEITFPRIREKVLKNPKIKKVYRTLIAKVYGN